MAASRKLYTAMAKTLNEVYHFDLLQDNEDALWAIREVVSRISSDLKDDNIHFDRSKFYRAAIDGE